MNLIDNVLCLVHYYNAKHKTLTVISWNIQKIIAKLVGRYDCIKTESGLILEESVEFECKQ